MLISITQIYRIPSLSCFIMVPIHDAIINSLYRAQGKILTDELNFMDCVWHSSDSFCIMYISCDYSLTLELQSMSVIVCGKMLQSLIIRILMNFIFLNWTKCRNNIIYAIAIGSILVPIAISTLQYYWHRFLTISKVHSGYNRRTDMLLYYWLDPWYQITVKF